MWEEASISSVCELIVDCVNRTAPVVDFDTGYKMIRTTNVRDGQIDLAGARFVTADTFKRWNRRATPRIGDIVLTREAPHGEVGRVRTSDKIFLGQRTMLFRADASKCDPGFLYYSLLTDFCQNQLKSFASGSTVLHIKVPDAKKVKIKLPPLPLQRQIAAVLGRYDALLENYRGQVAALEGLAQELYQEWFVRGRCPGVEAGSAGEKIKLGTFVNMNFGQSPSSEFYNDEDNGLPFHQGVGSYGNIFPIHHTFCSVDGKIAEKGDILFSVRAPVGRLNIADRKLIIGRGLAAINHKRGLNSFLSRLLQSAFSEEDIIGNGSIFNAVSRGELEAFEVDWHNEDMATKFNDLVNPIDAKIRNIDKQINLLRATRDALLPRLLSGQLLPSPTPAAIA